MVCHQETSSSRRKGLQEMAMLEEIQTSRARMVQRQQGHRQTPLQAKTQSETVYYRRLLTMAAQTARTWLCRIEVATCATPGTLLAWELCMQITFAFKRQTWILLVPPQRLCLLLTRRNMNGMWVGRGEWNSTERLLKYCDVFDVFLLQSSSENTCTE